MLPSVKTLSRIFGDNAKTARHILEVPKTAGLFNEYESVRHYRASCYKPQSLMVRMLALNDLGCFHGVEAIESENGEYAEYLNSGETYTETLIYWRGNFRVQDIGTFIERNRTKFK